MRISKIQSVGLVVLVLLPLVLFGGFIIDLLGLNLAAINNMKAGQGPAVVVEAGAGLTEWGNCRQNYLSGREYLINGQFELALEPLQWGARCDNDPWAWYYLGKAQYELGDLTGAVESWRRTPEGYDQAVRLARTAVEGGDEETILAAWNFAAEIGPNEQEPFIQLARLAETSEPENFEPLLRQAIEADPDAPAAYIVLGNYLVNQNNLVDAQMLFEQALAIGPPDEISLLMTMAQNSELLGDTAAAIEYWQTVAIRNERRRGMAYYQIGRLAFEDGNFSSALAFFKRANEIEPENNQFLLGLAGAYAKLGCRQVALDLYQTVLDTAKAAPVRDEAQAQLAELAVLHDEVTPCSDVP